MALIAVFCCTCTCTCTIIRFWFFLKRYAYLVVIEWTANLLHWAAPNLVRPRGRTSAPHLWAQLSSIFWTMHYSTPKLQSISGIELLHCIYNTGYNYVLKAWGMGITTKWHQICSAGVRPTFCTEPEPNVRLSSMKYSSGSQTVLLSLPGSD